MFSYALLIVLEISTAFFTNSGILGGSKNLYRMLFDDGAWSDVAKLRIESSKLNDEWGPVVQSQGLILHALGSYQYQNTLEAARKSFLTEIKLLEVDIFKDKHSNLRCHHGPEQPPLLSPDDCTLSRLLEILPPHKYLVLDIKTDFIATAEAVIDLLESDELDYHLKSTQIVFQLYKPSHLEWFHSNVLLNQHLNFSQPLITSYRTHADVAFLSQIMPPFVGGLTFPKFRNSVLLSFYMNFSSLISLPPLFVHPVGSCSGFSELLVNGYSAVYGPRALANCT